jgi:hypothetical protein
VDPKIGFLRENLKHTLLTLSVSVPPQRSTPGGGTKIMDPPVSAAPAARSDDNAPDRTLSSAELMAKDNSRKEWEILASILETWIDSQPGGPICKADRAAIAAPPAPPTPATPATGGGRGTGRKRRSAPPSAYELDARAAGAFWKG